MSSTHQNRIPRTELIESDERSVDTTLTVNMKHPTVLGHLNSAKRKKLKLLKEQRIENAVEVLQATSTLIDDSYHFGNLVSCKLRNFDEVTRCAIQSDILNVFGRASAACRATVYSNQIIDPSRSGYSSSPTPSDATARPQESQLQHPNNFTNPTQYPHITQYHHPQHECPFQPSRVDDPTVSCSDNESYSPPTHFQNIENIL